MKRALRIPADIHRPVGQRPYYMHSNLLKSQPPLITRDYLYAAKNNNVKITNHIFFSYFSSLNIFQQLRKQNKFTSVSHVGLTTYSLSSCTAGFFSAPATSGRKSVRLHYRDVNNLVNGGLSIDFIKVQCYSFIYIHFQLIISMSSEIMCDEHGKSFLPKQGS